jgi:hypothetical protein
LGEQRSTVCVLFTSRCNAISYSSAHCIANVCSNPRTFHSANSCPYERTDRNPDRSTFGITNGYPYHCAICYTNICSHGRTNWDSDSNTHCIAIEYANKRAVRSPNRCPHWGTDCADLVPNTVSDRLTHRELSNTVTDVATNTPADPAGHSQVHFHS